MNETKLRAVAGEMEYPRTPDVAGSVMMRLRRPANPRFRVAPKALAGSLATVLVLCSSLILIPSVRAALIEFIQIGIVRIFPQTDELTPEVITTATPRAVASPTVTPEDASVSLISLLDQIAGETKLANAQQIVPYPILLPTYPADLDQPDRVYVQDADGAMTILVWVDPHQPGKVTMSLHLIPKGSWAIEKMGPVEIDETDVNGHRAIWAMGSYPLRMRNGNLQFERLINGHVLIWADENITYRLETDLNLEEAVKIAESLKPIQ
ncbi:MAG: hypothetical protein HXY35_07715 [Chloroflexi bacterium]|nr:hypothetical protein [Chloroflexota bacterium]